MCCLSPQASFFVLVFDAFFFLVISLFWRSLFFDLLFGLVFSSFFSDEALIFLDSSAFLKCGQPPFSSSAKSLHPMFFPNTGDHILDPGSWDPYLFLLLCVF